MTVDMNMNKRFLEIVRGGAAKAKTGPEPDTNGVGASVPATDAVAHDEPVRRDDTQAEPAIAASGGDDVVEAATAVAGDAIDTDAGPVEAAEDGAAVTAAAPAPVGASGSDRPRTAAENAGGRDGKTIIDAMLADSRALGEPVTLRLPVTPEMASYVLSLNEANRRIAPVKLAQYVSDMKAGRWRENGEGISIAITGALNNGQHRMCAIEQSGATQVMNVTVGVTRESRGTNDTGKIRTSGDHLTMVGYGNGRTLSAVARLVLAYEPGSESLGSGLPITTTQIEEAVQGDPALQEAADFATTNKRRARKLMATSGLGFVRYLTSRIDAAGSDEFMEGLLTGAKDGKGLNVTDPRYKARERLLGMIKTNNQPERIEVLFRAWNAMRQGKELGSYITITGKLPKLR